MKKIIIATMTLGLLVSCSSQTDADADKKITSNDTTEKKQEFNYIADRFADIRILRYKINGFDELTLQQKKFAYYLTQAGLAGRDIIYDQNYKYNLAIRHALNNIVRNYKGEETEDWKNFMTYTKQVWFANGIHHHYSTDKFVPKFGKAYFEKLLKETNTTIDEKAMEAIFNPELDAKRVNLDPSVDIVAKSANNFYGEGVTEELVEEYYNQLKEPGDKTPISYGLNSKMVLKDGKIVELPWKIDGMYSTAIKQIIFWLEKATEVAENDDQKEALKLLIEYYQTGDLEVWDEYCIKWVQTTEGDIDYINGFIEVYGDSKGHKASYETIVQMKDFEASERMKVLAENAQWFEDNSPLMDEHKKEKVVGVTYNVVNVIGEAGDASPASPIGVNLPNAQWIREQYGSKSVSLGNLIEAYHNASGGSMTNEFIYRDSIAERKAKHGALASKLHTALHEVIGHASGKLEQGVETPSHTLKSYASALEEARADLVGLYFILDKKMVDLGLMKSLDVGKASYDSYIRNGLMTQLRRINLGDNIEEAHMRNRQLVAAWAYEKGKENNVIEKVVKEGKTYFIINDYKALKHLFGELLREIQRIKSQGDYAAGKALIETYGVKVDAELHKEVLKRFEKLDIAPYSGFINPKLVPVKDENGKITDINVEYPKSFKEQMLYYDENYGFLKP